MSFCIIPIILLLLSIRSVGAEESLTPVDPSQPQMTTEVLDTLENRPRRSLSASASQRRDYLANKETWVLKPDLTLHKLLDLPSWASLSVEERFRYETYDTPWIKNTTRGQWSVPIQSVVFGEIRPITNWRFGMEFWDARQWGPPDPNRIDNSMVNTLNFTQMYGAMIERNLWDGIADKIGRASCRERV